MVVRSIPSCFVNTSRALVIPASVGGMDKNCGSFKLNPSFLSAPRPWPTSGELYSTKGFESSLGPVLLELPAAPASHIVSLQVSDYKVIGSANGDRTRIFRPLEFSLSC